MLNTPKIKTKMKEMKLTQADIAKKLGIAKPTVSQKINGVRPITLDEAEKIAEILKIENDRFTEFFFAN